MTFLKMACWVIALVVIPARVLAADAFEPVSLAPVTHLEAELVVTGPGGVAQTYTPEELEQFATFRLRTTTPWRPEPAVFEGVMLNDVLAANGLSDVAMIKVRAENDFEVDIDSAVFKAVPIMIATRVNGRAHTRRERGPLQFVISDQDATAHAALVGEHHFVWMAAAITAER